MGKKTLRGLAAILVALAVSLMAGAAGAQTADPYTTPPPGSNNTPQQQAPPQAQPQPGSGGAQPSVQVRQPATALPSQARNNSTLPVTGGDVTQLVVLGLVLVAGGAGLVLVHRRRTAHS